MVRCDVYLYYIKICNILLFIYKIMYYNIQKYEYLFSSRCVVVLYIQNYTDSYNYMFLQKLIFI